MPYGRAVGRFDAVELRRVTLPLRAPFVTAHGIEHERHTVIVRVVGPDLEGWGECVALTEPTYTSEYTAGAALALETHLAPRLLTGGLDALAEVQGHRMAKASLELAVLDAELRTTGTSLAQRLGAVRERVPSGIALGLDATIDDVAGAVDAGYQRVKLKIAPARDVAWVTEVRLRFPDLPLQVDANGAYTLVDADRLDALDDLGLLLIEQPLGADDLAGHAALAHRLRTPLCLDEAITSTAAAEQAIALGACRVVNLKAGRMGGYLEAARAHDACRAAGVPVWCGGMLETGLGRAANLALAALPGFTLPGDLSPSDRWFAEDLTEPIVLGADGHLAVPTGPGIGVTPIPEILRRHTTALITVS
jgi:O-succinylbenzoate synthase